MAPFPRIRSASERALMLSPRIAVLFSPSRGTNKIAANRRAMNSNKDWNAGSPARAAAERVGLPPP
eukprot:2469516-Alexandrium_andersonii.AAC.1